MRPITFEKVSLADAKRVHEGTRRDRLRLDWTVRRSTNDHDEPLHATTVAWMSELPDNRRPVHLAEHFPRIANKICATWKQRARCAHYMAELLIVRRDARKGFPVAVAKEIGGLLAHHAVLHPSERQWTGPR